MKSKEFIWVIILTLIFQIIAFQVISVNLEWMYTWTIRAIEASMGLPALAIVEGISRLHRRMK